MQSDPHPADGDWRDLAAFGLSVRPKKAAQLLGISERTLWGLTAPRGPIPCKRAGTGPKAPVLYAISDLRAYVEGGGAHD